MEPTRRSKRGIRIEVQCQECGKMVKKKPWEVRASNKHFCSRECFRKWEKTGRGAKIISECLNCGKEVTRTKSTISQTGKIYCSRSCSTRASNRTRGPVTDEVKRRITEGVLKSLGKDPKNYTKKLPKRSLAEIKKNILKKILLGKYSGRRVVIKKYLIEEKIKPNVCEDCGINPFWNGKKLNFQLHHKNGDAKDNRVENLALLCPNCHSQTETFSGKNAIQAKRSASHY